MGGRIFEFGRLPVQSQCPHLVARNAFALTIGIGQEENGLRFAGARRLREPARCRWEIHASAVATPRHQGTLQRCAGVAARCSAFEPLRGPGYVARSTRERSEVYPTEPEHSLSVALRGGRAQPVQAVGGCVSVGRLGRRVRTLDQKCPESLLRFCAARLRRTPQRGQSTRIASRTGLDGKLDYGSRQGRRFRAAATSLGLLVCGQKYPGRYRERNGRSAEKRRFAACWSERRRNVR